MGGTMTDTHVFSRNIDFDIDGLREKIDLLQGQSGGLSWPKTSVQLSTELFILDNNLEDFVADGNVTGEYFQMVTGAFGKSVKGLEALLPNLTDGSLSLLAQEIIEGINGIIIALRHEGKRSGAWARSM